MNVDNMDVTTEDPRLQVIGKFLRDAGYAVYYMRAPVDLLYGKAYTAKSKVSKTINFYQELLEFIEAIPNANTVMLYQVIEEPTLVAETDEQREILNTISKDFQQFIKLRFDVGVE